MIAVTGANGLLGSFIVRKLHQQNIPFVGIKRKNSSLSNLGDMAEKINWRNIDIVDPISVHEALKGVSGVIHCAALVSYNPRMTQQLYDINVTGTRNIVDACLEHGIRRLLHVSSVAALGRQKEQTAIDETNKWIDSPLNTSYGESKYLAELEVFRGQEEGLSTVCINPSVILATADWNNSSAQLFKYVWNEKRFYIDGCMNYVDVRDVAEMVIHLYNSEIENERFIASAGSISFKEFFDKIAKHFDRRSPSVKLGKGMIRFVARLEHVRSILTGSNPLITRETARLADTNFVFKNEKAKDRLNLEFQTIDSTLAWCCEYYIKLNGAKNE